MHQPQQKADRRIRQFRQILLWPLQLTPGRAGSQIQKHWELLEEQRPDNPWHEVADEFTGDPSQFQVRHYSEFVTFLPYVQRFLYGEARHDPRRGQQGGDPGASPMRVFRRGDVAAVRVVVRPGEAPLTLRIAHVDLYFFFDIDVVLLNVEVCAEDLSLPEAEDVLHRLGRAYPARWDAEGLGVNCMHRLEWLAADGRVLAASDSQERDRYLSFVCRHRAPRIGAHWAFLLEPLVPDHAEEAPGRPTIHYRMLEYHRMPVMGYLAMDDPRALSRQDFIRLGLVGTPGEGALLSSERHLAEFEERHCYDRFWSGGPEGGQGTRYLCSGHALVVVGEAGTPHFVDPETGVLAQFRHQHFLLFLIAHLQKAALRMFADRLVDALERLEVGDAESVKRFKRAIRQNFETFLRFTHRYWFHEIADQAQTKALFRLCARHLDLDGVYAEVKDRISDMNEYLDTDSVRRQANTVVRLTVVTTFGLIGTILTGLFGMNLFNFGEGALPARALAFLACLGGVTALTFYAVVKSRRLSDFLDALSDERLTRRAKLRALLDVWRPREHPGG